MQKQKLSKTLDLGLEFIEESQGNGTMMCAKHPDKEIEAYCRKDKSLLCVKCILDIKHKEYDYIPIDKAFEEQQQNFKHILSKVLKNKESLLAKQKSITKIIDEIDSLKDKAIQDAENFYHTLTSKIENRKKECIQRLTRSFSGYKKDLCNTKDVFEKMEIYLQSSFYSKNNNLEDHLQNIDEILELDLSSQKPKSGFSFQKEKFSLLQFLRSEFKQPKPEIVIQSSLMKTRSPKISKIGAQSGEGKKSECGNYKSSTKIDILRSQNLNVSKEYDCINKSLFDLRSTSNNSRSTTKVKEFSSRITAPTKSSEMRVMKTKKPEPEKSKIEQKEDISSPTDESQTESDRVDTPVISFQTSEEEKEQENDITPIVSASMEIYGGNLHDTFAQDVKLGLLTNIQYEDFLKTPSHKVTTQKGFDKGFDEYCNRKGPSKRLKTKLTSLDYFKTRDEEVKFACKASKTSRKPVKKFQNQRSKPNSTKLEKAKSGKSMVAK